MCQLPMAAVAGVQQRQAHVYGVGQILNLQLACRLQLGGLTACLHVP